MSISDKLIKAKIVEIVSSGLSNEEKIKSFEVFIEEVKIGSYMSAFNEISREKDNKRREQEKLVLQSKGKIVQLDFKN